MGHGIRNAVKDTSRGKHTVGGYYRFTLLRFFVEAELREAMGAVDDRIATGAGCALKFVIDDGHWELKGNGVLVDGLEVHRGSRLSGTRFRDEEGSAGPSRGRFWVQNIIAEHFTQKRFHELTLGGRTVAEFHANRGGASGDRRILSGGTFDRVFKKRVLKQSANSSTSAFIAS